MKKIAINYYLQYPKKVNSPILISVNWEGKRYQCSTGVTVPVKAFDSVKKKVKSSYGNSSEINAFLQNLITKITDKYYKSNTHDLDFGKETIQELITGNTSDNLNTSKINIVNYGKENINYFIKLFINDKYSSKQIFDRSVQKYNTLIKKIELFENECKYTLPLVKIDVSYIEKFTLFLAKDLNNTTIEKYLRCIKVIVNYAFSKGYIQSKQLNSLISQVVKSYNINTQTIKETLTESDLKLIEDHFPNSVRLEKVKDLFLTQIYTGFRYSDLYQIRKEVMDIKNYKIKIYQEKTQDYLEANLSSKLLKILKKYSNYSLAESDGKILSNQNYNYAIKDLCRDAGITYEVPITKFVLKKKTVEFVPKWQLISSHSARSAYITISLKRGLLPEEIMVTSGHKDRASFQRYVKISQNEALNRVHQVWE